MFLKPYPKLYSKVLARAPWGVKFEVTRYMSTGKDVPGILGFSGIKELAAMNNDKGVSKLSGRMKQHREPASSEFQSKYKEAFEREEATKVKLLFQPKLFTECCSVSME